VGGGHIGCGARVLYRGLGRRGRGGRWGVSDLLLLLDLGGVGRDGGMGVAVGEVGLGAIGAISPIGGLRRLGKGREVGGRWSPVGEVR